MTELRDQLVQFKPNTPEQSGLVDAWLKLGVLSLALAGLFAILLVLSRAPGGEQFFPWVNFFRTALVVHVDQSVLIWFLAMAGMVLSLNLPSGAIWLRTQWFAFYLCLAGTLGIAASAFVGTGEPLMNNYVPVLQRPFFYITLGLFGLGIGIHALLVMINSPQRLKTGTADIAPVAAVTVAFAVMIALFALLVAWQQIPAEIVGEGYFEYLFWGSGHTLQFAYTQLMMLAWLVLAATANIHVRLKSNWVIALILIGAAPVLLTPVIYALYDTVSSESRLAFTRLMQYGGGIAAVPMMLVLIYSMLGGRDTRDDARPVYNCLKMSLTLFAAGGLISLFISGVNTIIPAHYHGSIVGVTLALMGLAYVLLPRLGYQPVKGRLASIQPWVYGVGQLLHIIGLAASGAMGIQRKTAGAAQALDTVQAKLAMGVMGIGGLLAVIGGILFVWVMLTSFWRGKNPA